MNDIQQLIGRPWEAGAEGPATFDCYGLLRHIYKSRLGIELKRFPGIVEAPLETRCRAVIEYAAEDTWTKLARPEDLCAVGMSNNRLVHHVGVWLSAEGGVLHAKRESGVVFQTIVSLRASGITNLSFYRFNKP